MLYVGLLFFSNILSQRISNTDNVGDIIVCFYTDYLYITILFYLLSHIYINVYNNDRIFNNINDYVFKKLM